LTSIELVISERFGTLTEMAIDWKSYIESLLRGVKKHISEEVFTRDVGEARRTSAGMTLSLLRLSYHHPVFVANDRALFFLQEKGKLFVAIFFAPIADLTSIKGFDAQASLLSPELRIKDVAAHFFFLLKNVEIDIHAESGEVLAEFLQARVDFVPGSKEKIQGKSLDFDKVCEAYGRLAIWEFLDGDSVARYLDVLLFAGSNGGSIKLCQSGRLVGAFSKAFPDLRIIDLPKVFSALILPIEQALDRELKPAGVSMPNAGQYFMDATGIEVTNQSVAFGVGGGACFSFTRAGSTYVALSVRGLRDWERRAVPENLRRLGAIREEFSRAHLIAFMAQLDGAVQLHPNLSSSDEALENLVSFDGMNILDLARIGDIFEELEIFDVSETEELSPAHVLANLAVNFKSARAAFVSPSIADVAKRLVNIHGAPVDNIYLSLSASHWKHCFIEAYRIIEGLYYFAWMHKLKLSLNSSLTEFDLLNHCQSAMAWKYTEDSSIKELFALVPVSVLDKADPKNISCLGARLFDGSKAGVEVMRGMAAAIYSIRNANIHQGELTVEKPIEVTAACWAKLTLCLYLVIEFFYDKHHSGVPKGAVIKKTHLQSSA